MEHQIHFGKKFYKDLKTGYWISTSVPKIRAHVWVWEQVNGKRPPKHHIHHIDGNKSNNSIENLECIFYKDHLSIHSSTEEHKKISRKNIKKAIEAAKAWHGSEEGLEWHRQHAKNFNFGKHEKKEYKCEMCAKTYFSSKLHTNRFCSNACKSASRRSSGLDDIEKNCVICSAQFKSNKYQKKISCSEKCRGQIRKYKKNNEIK